MFKTIQKCQGDASTAWIQAMKVTSNRSTRPRRDPSHRPRRPRCHPATRPISSRTMTRVAEGHAAATD